MAASKFVSSLSQEKSNHRLLLYESSSFSKHVSGSNTSSIKEKSVSLLYRSFRAQVSGIWFYFHSCGFGAVFTAAVRYTYVFMSLRGTKTPEFRISSQKMVTNCYSADARTCHIFKIKLRTMWNINAYDGRQICVPTLV